MEIWRENWTPDYWDQFSEKNPAALKGGCYDELLYLPKFLGAVPKSAGISLEK